MRAACDFTKAGCLACLRGLDRELEEAYPRLHIYVYNGYLVQPATGRRVVYSVVGDIPEVERMAASASPLSFIASSALTSKKPTPTQLAGRSAQEGYTMAPGQVQLAATELAAFILSRITSSRGKEYLREKAGGVGALMLHLLEQRGATPARCG